MRRTIRLRESELRRMISESVRRVLNEIESDDEKNSSEKRRFSGRPDIRVSKLFGKKPTRQVPPKYKDLAKKEEKWWEDHKDF